MEDITILKKELKKKPFGSFPPIFVCDTNVKQEEDKLDNIKGFSYGEQKNAVSLKEIMQERRDDVKPFFIL